MDGQVSHSEVGADRQTVALEEQLFLLRRLHQFLDRDANGVVTWREMMRTMKAAARGTPSMIASLNSWKPRRATGLIFAGATGEDKKEKQKDGAENEGDAASNAPTNRAKVRANDVTKQADRQQEK